jgi:predicted nuclease of predicted toxin-antitoxin system
MKILLDECIPVRLRKHLSDFEVSTVTEMGWTSLKNGKLIKIAVESGFDIMITVDKNLQHQQNLNKFELSIVVFDVLYNRIQDFVPLIPKFIEIQPILEKRKVYVIK